MSIVLDSILLDECIPKRLGKYLMGYDYMCAIEMGWVGMKSCDLLKVAQGYEVLFTADRDLIKQQNLTNLDIIVIVLTGKSNRLVDLIPLVPKALVAIPLMKPGEVMEISSA